MGPHIIQIQSALKTTEKWMIKLLSVFLLVKFTYLVTRQPITPVQFQLNTSEPETSSPFEIFKISKITDDALINLSKYILSPMQSIDEVFTAVKYWLQLVFNGLKKSILMYKYFIK